MSCRVCRVFPSSFKSMSGLTKSQSQSVVSTRVHRLLEAFVSIRVDSYSCRVYSCSCLFVFVSTRVRAFFFFLETRFSAEDVFFLFHSSGPSLLPLPLFLVVRLTDVEWQ